MVTVNSSEIRSRKDFFGKDGFVYRVKIQDYIMDRYDTISNGLYNQPRNIFALRKMGCNTSRYPFEGIPSGVRVEALRIASIWVDNPE